MVQLSVIIVDVTVFLVVLLSAGYAAWRGLMRETLSIFSWVVAAYLTVRFYPTFRPMMRELIAPERLADLLGLIVLFVVVLVPLSVLTFHFSETVKKTEIGPLDRALGFMFGVGRGFVIVGLAYVGFSAFVPAENHPTWLTGARLFPLVYSTGDVLLSLAPGGGRANLDNPEAVGGAGVAPARDEPQTYGADERAGLDRLIETTGRP